nr:MFS transporter [Pseudomonas rhodesiae]
MTINSYGNTADTSVAYASPQKRQAQRYLQKVTWIATFGGLLFGFDTGVINGALLYMKDDLGLTPFTEGLVASALLIGAMLGALCSGRLSDLKGRRRIILFLAVLFFLGALACALAPTLNVMVAARFTLGLAVGGASVVVPAYLAEMAPSSIRGRIITRNELMIVTGQFLAFTTNATLGNVRRSRWCLALDACLGHAASRSTLVGNALHARKPALAGNQRPLQRGPGSPETGTGRVLCQG